MSIRRHTNRTAAYQGEIKRLDDKVKTAAQDVAGKAEEAAGKHQGDEDLEREGNADQTKANLNDAGENVKDAFK